MSLFEQASLVVTPNGYKAGKLYSIKPTSGAGDLDVVRATGATRVNASGLIETVANNVPRLDYPPLGGCPSCLVEPQRTNLLLRSEEFDVSPWSNFVQGAGTAPIIAANYTIAPDGTLTADRVQCDIVSLGSPNRSARAQSYSVVNGQVYTCTVYVKSNTGTNQNFSVQNSALIVSAGFSTQGIATNEWTRFVIQGTAIITGTSAIRIGLIDSLLSTTNDISIWGAQLEAGANATSYIPTVASTVTRNADVISKTGISDLIGQTEGTLFAEVDINKINETSRVFLNISSGFPNFISINFLNTNRFRAAFRSSSGSILNIDSSVFGTGIYKVAVTYIGTELKLYVNGVLEASRSDVNTNFSASLTNIALDNSILGGQHPDSIYKAVAILPTAITQAEAIQLTTL